jgi:hypothetical protein
MKGARWSQRSRRPHGHHDRGCDSPARRTRTSTPDLAATLLPDPAPPHHSIENGPDSRRECGCGL